MITATARARGLLACGLYIIPDDAAGWLRSRTRWLASPKWLQWWATTEFGLVRKRVAAPTVVQAPSKLPCPLCSSASLKPFQQKLAPRLIHLYLPSLLTPENSTASATRYLCTEDLSACSKKQAVWAPSTRSALHRSGLLVLQLLSHAIMTATCSVKAFNPATTAP
jgi:hypothetical protein